MLFCTMLSTTLRESVSFVRTAGKLCAAFIISQNNNIKRIKGIVERLCESFGSAIGDGLFSFPSPQTLAAASVEDLAPLAAASAPNI